MTASEILNIITTVAITQAVVDLLCRYFVFSRDPYRRAVSTLQRLQVRRDKVQQSAHSTNSWTTTTTERNNNNRQHEKQIKKLQQIQDDCSDAASDVARRHTVPGFVASVVFLMLCRVLGTEYAGNVIALLPFTPFRLMRKLTLRGLHVNIDHVAAIIQQAVNDGKEQQQYNNNIYHACSFLFIYILCALSVKYFVHLAVGVSPPKEADGGLSTVMEGRQNQKILKALGIHTDLKLK